MKGYPNKEGQKSKLVTVESGIRPTAVVPLLSSRRFPLLCVNERLNLNSAGRGDLPFPAAYRQRGIKMTKPNFSCLGLYLGLMIWTRPDGRTAPPGGDLAIRLKSSS